MKTFGRFNVAIKHGATLLKNLGYWIHPHFWQGMDVKSRPEAMMREYLNYSFTCPIWTDRLGELRNDIEPNIPWADDHFLERVGGKPLNPGVQWKNWPWANSADQFRKNEKFSHTYMERYWPRNAGYTTGGDIPSRNFEMYSDNQGIRYAYGDLNDVVTHLANDPGTRQAYLPVWFPEDTGVVHKERVPCTIGYHFVQRHGFLHTTYYIRSCDYYRHMRDDIYLTVRLALWVLDQLRQQGEPWNVVKPGLLTMHIVSLHLFQNDYIKLWGKPDE